MSSLIGRTLGQYEVTDMLGRGGMATVYLGRQTSIDRMVAIKVLPPHPGLDEQFKQRFELEAKTIGSLQHPSILPLYDYGSHEDVLYLVMAYVEGGTLEDIMDGPMDILTIEQLLRNIAGGLDFAHRKGVIHRDIKPANILMNEGHPLLADFGMVKMMAASSNLTGTAIVGTPSYMAPEQGQGMDVDHRVDVYALGVMLYEMLTGTPPYTSDNPMQTILKHINEPIPDVLDKRPDLPLDVAYVIEKAMEKDPQLRFASAGDVAEAFSAAIHDNSDSLAGIRQAYPITIPEEQSRTSPEKTARLAPPPTTSLNPPDSTVIIRETTNPYVLMGGFGLIAIVIVIVAIVLINNQNAPVPPPPTAIAEETTVPTELPTTSTEAPAAVPTAEPEPNFGEIRYTSDAAYGDTVSIRVSNLQPLSSDQQYAAWLINTESNEALSLGRILVDSFGEGAMTFIDEEGRLLPAHFNALIITIENEIGDTPVGETAYTAQEPIEVSLALYAIFVASESGLNGGSLLDGAVTEAGFAQQHSGLAAKANNIGGVRSHGEHTINILRGEQEDYDGNERGSNPGRGFGVYVFLDEIDAVLESATNHEDATIDLQVNAEYIRVCTANVRLWADEIVEVEKTMIAAESIETIQEEMQHSTQLANQLTAGFDANVNEIVEPFEGECGMDQIPEYGLQFARMDIVGVQAEAE